MRIELSPSAVEIRCVEINPDPEQGQALRPNEAVK